MSAARVGESVGKPVGRLAETPAHLLRWLGRLTVVLLVVGATAVSPRTAPAAAGGEPRLHPLLLREAARSPEQTFRVVVKRQQNDRSGDALVEKKARAGKGARKLKEVAADAFVAEVKGADLAELAQSPGVSWVTPDAVMINTAAPAASKPNVERIDATRLATSFDQAIHATGVWPASSTSSGVTGRSVGVAIVDSGIAESLPDFRDGRDRRIAARVSFSSGASSPIDFHGHGTHVAGIVAGDSWQSSDRAVRGKYIGVAPRAHLVNVKVSDDQGMAYLSDVVNGIEWVIKNRQAYNIRVMNLSLISSVPESYRTSVLAAAVERAWFNGILVVVSAGNMGADSVHYPPANDPFVITAGATDTQGTWSPADDTVVSWSSYGTSLDGVSKPDVVAPGRQIVSPLAAKGSTLALTYPDRITDEAYIRMSGTSMAAPMVAGAAALIFEQHPEWTNDQVKWVLSRTALRLQDSPGQGAGQIDAAAAVRYSGTPELANQGTLISLLLTGPGGTSVYVNPNTSSWTTSSWTTSSWTTSSWTTSSWTTSSWTTSSWTTSSWTTSSWTTSSWTSSFGAD